MSMTIEPKSAILKYYFKNKLLPLYKVIISVVNSSLSLRSYRNVKVLRYLSSHCCFPAGSGWSLTCPWTKRNREGSKRE
jgi:hypothetical protein